MQLLRAFFSFELVIRHLSNQDGFAAGHIASYFTHAVALQPFLHLLYPFFVFHYHLLSHQFSTWVLSFFNSVYHRRTTNCFTERNAEHCMPVLFHCFILWGTEKRVPLWLTDWINVDVTVLFIQNWRLSKKTSRICTTCGLKSENSLTGAGLSSDPSFIFLENVYVSGVHSNYFS